MKNKFLLVVAAISVMTVLALLVPKPAHPLSYGRRVDRDWTVAKVTANAGAARITFGQSGAFWINVQGAASYIAFNATANVDSIKIADGGSVDFFPANVRKGEYATIYSASAITANYILTD